MDQIRVLKRAWEITWRYRALWVFGIILALTTGGGLPPRGDGGNGGAQYQFDGEDFFGPNGRFPVPRLIMPEMRLFRESGRISQMPAVRSGGNTTVASKPMIIGSQAKPFCQTRYTELELTSAYT